MRASACVCCEITQGVRFITGIVSGHRRVYDVRSRSHITGGTICYWHRPVYVARSHITVGTICHWHRRAFVVRSHMTGVRFVTGIGGVCCEVTHHSGYDLLLASACVCCEITHHRGYHLLRASACVCSGSRRVATDIYIYGYTDKLSIYLSIDKPTSLYPMYHRKKST